MRAAHGSTVVHEAWWWESAESARAHTHECDVRASASECDERECSPALQTTRECAHGSGTWGKQGSERARERPARTRASASGCEEPSAHPYFRQPLSCWWHCEHQGKSS